jgi:hypothetical protein
LDCIYSMWDLLPPEVQGALRKAILENGYRTRPRRGASIRSCPSCGSRNTADCQCVSTIEDSTVGLCISCGYLWCLECDAPLITSVVCGHWEICTRCESGKDTSGDCGEVAWECARIKAWLKRAHPVV